MVKTKFTPGPWTIEDCGGYQIRKEYNGKAYVDEPIAMVAQRHREPKKTRGKANLFLIAAAPDLYECLEEAVGEMCHVLPEGGWEGPCKYYDSEKGTCNNKDGGCFVKKWIKALQKARGKMEIQLEMPYKRMHSHKN